MEYKNIDIYNATNYMHEYKIILNDYNLHVGLIGRFFDKLFGTRKYCNIEKYLEHAYNLSWVDAAEILRNSGNDKDIFCPHKKKHK